MDQFDHAKVRAAKLQAKRVRYQPLHEGSLSKITDDEDVLDMLPETVTLAKPIKVKLPKTPAKRTNEIAITIYVDGDEIHLTARMNLNDIIGSQRNRAGLTNMLRDALTPKFGKVEIT